VDAVSTRGRPDIKRQEPLEPFVHVAASLACSGDPGDRSRLPRSQKRKLLEGDGPYCDGCEPAGAPRVALARAATVLALWLMLASVAPVGDTATDGPYLTNRDCAEGHTLEGCGGHH